MSGVTDYGAFCASVLVFLALPGPGTFALLLSTAKGGLRAGAAAVCGVIVGDQILLWCAVAGIAALLAANPAAFHVVQWAGAAYLGWIGLRLIFSASSASAAPVRIEPAHYGRQAFLITLMNPKAIIFYMAFFPLFVDPQHASIGNLPVHGGTIAVITAVYGLALCAVAQRLVALISQRRGLARWLERAAGICLVAFGLRLVSA